MRNTAFYSRQKETGSLFQVAKGSCGSGKNPDCEDDWYDKHYDVIECCELSLGYEDGKN